VCPCAYQIKSEKGKIISTEPRINDRIRTPEVRLIGFDGEQIGVVSIDNALAAAEEVGLDLVEIAPDAKPPVCKIMDFGKYKYEAAQKAREARQHQTHIVVKEMRLRPKIEEHDYQTKKRHIESFLNGGDKVKVTIQFRGREQARPEMGFKVLQRLAAELEEISFVEFAPKQEGRNMTMVLATKVKKQSKK
jgi:translation initiation factor IF-3